MLILFENLSLLKHLTFLCHIWEIKFANLLLHRNGFENVVSMIACQRAWRRKYGPISPSDKTILQTCKRFKETGSIHDLKRDGRLRVSDKVVEAVREHFEENPNSSLRQASRKMYIPNETLRKTKILNWCGNFSLYTCARDQTIICQEKNIVNWWSNVSEDQHFSQMRQSSVCQQT